MSTENHRHSTNYPHILVVDDTVASLQLMTKVLGKHGYNVSSATSGVEALKLVAVEEIDLILLDVRMPNMDGFELCAKLKANTQTSKIPVIFISALEDVADKVKGFNVGGVDYLTKPFQTAEVLVRIETHLSLTCLQKQMEQNNIQLQQEIAERRRIEEALIAAEEKFHKAFNYCADVIGMINASDKRYIEVNEAFTKSLGYDRKDVIGRTSEEFGLWSSTEDYFRVHESIRTERVIQNEEMLWVTKAGLRRIGICSAEVIEIGGKGYIIFVWHDITERKQAEETLREAKDKLEEKVETRTAELKAINVDLQEANTIIEEEILERRKIEEELSKTNVKLLQMIDALKITQKHLILQEKMAGIGQLAAGVAHEINNPLGFVMSNFTILNDYFKRLETAILAYRGLKEYLSTVEDTSLRQQIEAIKRLERDKKIDFVLGDLREIFEESKDGLERVGTIVKALRGFSRIDVQNQLGYYDLNAAVKTTLIIAKNEVKYVADTIIQLGEIPLVQEIGGMINQVLLNIIVNAAQAIKAANLEGKGIIKIETYCEEDFVGCSITNNGPEIPVEIQDRIFEPFFTTKPIGNGTGLGLSISYDIIVKQHGGKLTFTTSPDKGTTFTFKLPVKL